MNRTKIPWCDYTVNPVKGLCPMRCKTPEGYEYCYAAGERGLYKRFKWNPEIRFEPEGIVDKLAKARPGDKIFWGSTIELFGEWVDENWLEWCFDCVKIFNDRIHIFLTKQPQNLVKWSPFPENCWVGVTVCDNSMYVKALPQLVVYYFNLRNFAN
jgi:protein gp37